MDEPKKNWDGGIFLSEKSGLSIYLSIFLSIHLSIHLSTADFTLKVLGVYTRLMETIYLSLRAQVAVGSFFMKSPVYKDIYAAYELSKKNWLKKRNIH